MPEREEIKDRQFCLIESPNREIHGLIINRYPNRGFIIDNFARIGIESIEPECLLVKISPLALKNATSHEQILRWNMLYKFEDTEYFMRADLELHPKNLYARAKIILDIPREILVFWDERCKEEV